MHKIAVIAGSADQYRRFIRQLVREDSRKYYYLRTHEIIEGMRDIDFIAIGSWRQHPNIERILHTLTLANAVQSCCYREKTLDIWNAYKGFKDSKDDKS